MISVALEMLWGCPEIVSVKTSSRRDSERWWGDLRGVWRWGGGTFVGSWQTKVQTVLHLPPLWAPCQQQSEIISFFYPQIHLKSTTNKYLTLWHTAEFLIPASFPAWHQQLILWGFHFMISKRWNIIPIRPKKIIVHLLRGEKMLYILRVF